MCRASTPKRPQEDAVESQGKQQQSRLFDYIWPVPPLVLVALFPLLPTSFYLNRGYTVWFHCITVMFVLTRSEFLGRFLVLQGTSITLGWYAAICNDFWCHGRFWHILYMNMPAAMTNAMTVVQEGGTTVVHFTALSMSVMLLSHALDTFAHPGLTYLLWKRHSEAHGSSDVTTRTATSALQSILTWPVIISTYLTSRLWSVVHVYYNTGKFGLFYFGHDVYMIHDLDSWLPAYLAEGLLYVAIVIYKIQRSRKIKSMK